MSKKIQVKNVDVLKALLNRKIHPTLLDIIFWIAEKYGLCFTEAYREPRGRGDVHCTDPLRAVDLRSWFYENDHAYFIEGEINRRWQYDPARPDMKVAMIHSVDGGALHFHIQVHPNTRGI